METTRLDQTIKDIIMNKSLTKDEKLSDILKYLFVDLCNIDQHKYFILGSYSIWKKWTVSDLDINLDNKEFYKLHNLTEWSIG